MDKVNPRSVLQDTTIHHCTGLCVTHFLLVAVGPDVETRMAYSSHSTWAGAGNQSGMHEPVCSEPHLATSFDRPDGAPAGELIPGLYGAFTCFYTGTQQITALTRLKMSQSSPNGLRVKAYRCWHFLASSCLGKKTQIAKSSDYKP